MLIGWLTEVPWFWIAVGVPVAAATTLLVTAKFQHHKAQSAITGEFELTPNP
jgi:hypothetical protein